MEIRHFHYIRTIYETGSISRAAEKLYISQPSLSQLLKSVEKKVGAPLFDRGSQPLRPTTIAVPTRWIVVHGDDGHLGKAPPAQCAAQRIEPCDRGGREDAVGIRDVAVAVGPLHVGDIRGAVGRATGPEARKQQHGEQKQSFHDRKDKRSEVKKQIAPYRVRIR